MINQRELDVLNVLWGTNKPMISTEIVESSKGKGLTQSTVSAVLRKLVNDGLVEVCGTTHNVKVLARQYRYTDKSKQVILDEFAEMYHAVKNVIPLEELVAHLKGQKS